MYCVYEIVDSGGDAMPERRVYIVHRGRPIWSSHVGLKQKRGLGKRRVTLSGKSVMVSVVASETHFGAGTTIKSARFLLNQQR